MEHSKKMVLDAHKRGKTRRSSGLQEHRRRQHRAVSERAKYGNCEICRWTPGTDMHHIYGRGKSKTDWREQTDALLWVCRSCHPLPIQTPGFPSDEGGANAEKTIIRLFGEGVIEKHRRAWRDVT